MLYEKKNTVVNFVGIFFIIGCFSFVSCLTWLSLIPVFFNKKTLLGQVAIETFLVFS